MSWTPWRSAWLRLSAGVLVLSSLAVAAGSATFDDDAPIHRTGREPGATSPPDARPRFHDGSAGSCRTCHFAPEDGGGRANDADEAGAERSERRLDPTRSCLRCHDGVEGIPDVIGDDANGLAQRSAGQFAAVDEPSLNGHDLGTGLDARNRGELCARCHAQPMAGARVTCVDCHDPHGNGNARMLRWSSAPRSTPPLGLFTNPAASGVARYEERNVAYGTLDGPALREPSSMCIDCHHTFSGPGHTQSGAGGHYVRHPSYDSERGAPNRLGQGAESGTIALAHWERGEGTGFDGVGRLRTVVPGATSFAAASRVSGDNGVNCLTCHRAHGSSHGFALTWNPAGGAPRSGCEQCHAVSEEPGAVSAGAELSATR